MGNTAKSNKRHECLAGAGAGALASFIVCPLDVVKTRKQYDYKGLLSGLSTFQTMRAIWKREGFLQLYNGVLPSTIGYVSAWSVYFMTYGTLKNYFNSQTDPLLASGFQTILVSSVLAGCASTTTTSPIWVLRTKMMTDPNAKSMLHAFMSTLRSGGIGAFYRGLVPSYLGLLHVAVQFPLYERLRTSSLGPKNESLNVLVCSIVSKICASLATYPHEVLRTRLQTLKYSKYSGLTDSIVTIWREEGVYGYYKGLSSTLIRVIPTTAIIFVAHHLLLEWLSREAA